MHVRTFFQETARIAETIDLELIETLARELASLRDRDGRLFLLGVGGGAANCGHAATDFRKLCAIEAYAPTDNVSELTARANDEGWETIFSGWLKASRACERDAVFVFSVGGGNVEKNVSLSLVAGLKEAKARGMKVFGVVGRSDGYAMQVGDCMVVVPTVEPARLTPHTEAFQAVVWHCLVSHPSLLRGATKW